MLNYEHAPALGATQIAAEIAERLGLVELRATALVTIGLCRFHAGEPGALADLHQALEFCRDHDLPSLRAAAQTVAEALREHGERGHEMGDATGGTVAAPSAWPVSSEWRDGDWNRFLTDADALLGTPEGDRDPQVRGARGWIRVLRGDDGGVKDGTDALDAARSSGMWRPTWAGLAHAALSHAVRDETTSAADLLRELGESWRRMKTIASGEWVSTASHAAILAGPDAAALLRDVLADAPAHTAWSRAALSSLDGALAASRHDLASASRWHRDAAERYASLGSRTDRVFALAAAARALASAGDPDAAALVGEVADFASRNAAPNLLSLASPPSG
jgi:hypothetical protein